MAWKFKLDIVDPDRHIVTIKPTRGTVAKTLFWSTAPSLVLYGAMALYLAVASRPEETDLDLHPDLNVVDND